MLYQWDQLLPRNDDLKNISLTSKTAEYSICSPSRVLYRRDQLLRQIGDLLKNFDAELRVLRHSKYKLDIDLKNGDLRHVTLFEELLLLKDFEKQENFLADKVEGKQQEKLDMQAKVGQVAAHIFFPVFYTGLIPQ